MFLYRGIDEKGEIRDGSIEAVDKNTAFELLRKQGIRALEIKEQSEKRVFLRNIFNIKPSDYDISYLLLQLSIMLNSGLTLIQALDGISSQIENKRISKAVLIVKEGLERGVSLPLAFQNARIFPDFLIDMLKVAVTGENLEHILRMSSQYLDKSSELKNKILNSLTYPLLVISMSFLSVVLIVNLIIPKISQTLAGFGKELPMVTKLIISISTILGYLIYALPLFLMLFILRYKIFKRESLSLLFLKIPLIGRVSYYFNISRFSKMLNMCLSSGIPILRSIELSTGSITNFYMKNQLKNIGQEVAKGKSLKEVFSESKIFPELYINLINTGEKSGEIEKILILTSEIYDREAMKLINFWLRFIEPAAILLIGVVVAIIIMSVILPLTEIATGVKK